MKRRMKKKKMEKEEETLVNKIDRTPRPRPNVAVLRLLAIKLILKC